MELIYMSHFRLVMLETILALVAAPGFSQMQSAAGLSMCEGRVGSIVGQLEPLDHLRNAVEHGSIGDGNRSEWMNMMHNDGVVRADFEIDFLVGRSPEHLRVSSASYYR